MRFRAPKFLDDTVETYMYILNFRIQDDDGFFHCGKYDTFLIQPHQGDGKSHVIHSVS